MDLNWRPWPTSTGHSYLNKNLSQALRPSFRTIIDSVYKVGKSSFSSKSLKCIEKTDPIWIFYTFNLRDDHGSYEHQSKIKYNTLPSSFARYAWKKQALPSGSYRISEVIFQIDISINKYFKEIPRISTKEIP